MRTLLRFFYVWHILAKYRINDLLSRSFFNNVITGFMHCMPSAWSKKNKKQSIEIRLRLALEELGPIYIKLGQAISTRADLLPKEMVDELSKLQDKVPPFSNKEAIKIIESELKQPIDEVFSFFDYKILGSASIAQVYNATLKSGESIVVKVIRPGIKKVIDNDISVMRFLARLVSFFYCDTKRLRLVEVVKEFENTIHLELDLLQEAANCMTLRNDFSDSDIIYVPTVYWNYCTTKVMVMEKIIGVSVTNMKAFKENNVDLKLLAERGVEIFFTQVFYNQYFHADMHPGNVFVDISEPNDPKYIAVDFGIMGSLNDKDQYYLAENFLAFFNRDYRRVAELHINSGWVPSHISVTEFEASIRRASEPIFGKPLKEISFAQFLLTLFQIARKHEMEVQPQLVLLQKTFFNIEGLGRVLYPDLDLWETGKPILEKWMKDQFSPIFVAQKMKKHSREYMDFLTILPLTMKNHLDQSINKQSKQNYKWLFGIGFGVLLFIGFQPIIWGGDLARGILLVLALLSVVKLIKS